MQNPISLDLPPEGLILDPFQAAGVHLPGPTPGLWRVLPAPRIHSLGATEPACFSRSVEVATLPLHLTDLWLRPTGVTLGGRSLFSGRKGLALLAQIKGSALPAFFALAQARPGPRQIPTLKEDLAPGTPFVVLPGTTLAETLGHLCLVAETGVKGPIYLQTAAEDRAYLLALFPDLRARMIFDPPALHLAEAIVPTTLSPALFLMSQAEWAVFEHEFPPVGTWQGRHADPASIALLARHSVDATLLPLRARGLAAIQPDHDLPKRFWIASDPPTPGTTDLAEMLELFGFQPIDLPSLSPLQQIALFAGAEMVIGAPPFPLLFAAPDATVVTYSPEPLPDADVYAPVAVSGCRLLHFQTAPEGLSRLDLARLMSLIVSLLDQIPSFQSADDVQILGQHLMAIGERARAAALFQAHAPLSEGHIGLSLARADLADLQGDKAATLAMLYAAYRADPTDWAILIRMLWCARAMDQSDLTTTLLATLHDGFPERFEAFSRARPWVRDFYSPKPTEAP